MRTPARPPTVRESTSSSTRPQGRRGRSRLPPRCAAGLPGADVHELTPGEELSVATDPGAIALGAAGGDGTLSAVARLAVERDLPFVAVPSGTLNHLARDLGLNDVDDAIAAVRAGHDDGHGPGAGRRPRLRQHAHARWLLPRSSTRASGSNVGSASGRRCWWRSWWSCAAWSRCTSRSTASRCGSGWRGSATAGTSPTGFRPSWRERLDDGLLDVRLVVGDRPFSRLRFVVHVMAGRLRLAAPCTRSGGPTPSPSGRWTAPCDWPPTVRPTTARRSSW